MLEFALVASVIVVAWLVLAAVAALLIGRAVSRADRLSHFTWRNGHVAAHDQERRLHR
jgi:multisubunit Na+/H+ antiporter MnhG subunit